jgi:ribonuclease E
MKDNTGQVLVQVPVEIANFLLNEKRTALSEIERRHDAPIVIVADEQLQAPHYEVTRIRENELGEETSRPSYQRGTPRKLATIALTKANLNVPPPAVVRNVKPTQPAPVREPRPAPVAETPVPAATPASGGFMGWLKSLFAAPEAASAQPAPLRARDGAREERGDAGGQRRERDRRNGGRQQRRGQPGQGQGQGQAQKEAKADNAQKSVKPAQQNASQKPKSSRQPRQAQVDKGEAGQTRAQTREKPQDKGRGQAQDATPDVKAKMASPDLDQAADGVSARNADDKASIGPTDAAPPAATTQPGDMPIDSAPSDGANADDGTKSEGSGRRRRGRRGGRRRRKPAAEAAATAESSDALEAAANEPVAEVDGSQPEFDFVDVPTARGPHEAPGKTATPVTQAASVATAVTAAAAADAGSDSASEPSSDDISIAGTASVVPTPPASVAAAEAGDAARNEGAAARAPATASAEQTAESPATIAQDAPGQPAPVKPVDAMVDETTPAAAAAASVATAPAVSSEVAAETDVPPGLPIADEHEPAAVGPDASGDASRDPDALPPPATQDQSTSADTLAASRPVSGLFDPVAPATPAVADPAEAAANAVQGGDKDDEEAAPHTAAGERGG